MSVEGAWRALSSGMRGEVRRDEPMARHTSFRLGGPADLFCVCDTLGDLTLAVDVLEQEEVPSVVLGKGTNVLVSDDGYRGAVLVLGEEFRRHSVDDETIRAGAAVSLARLVQVAFKSALDGLAFAVGIPGTFGGALAMNAGTRDRWIGEVTTSVTVYEPGRGLRHVRGSQVDWGYRTSDLPERGIIIEGVLRCEAGDAGLIRARMDRGFKARTSAQPTGVASAGSVFVNPEGDSAGRLIETAGLKGASIGGARVSDLHANFIVNEGSATARDVYELVGAVRAAVKEEHGIELEPEVRLLGSFG